VIFVDASAFLRHLAEARTPQDHANALRAKALFQAVAAGTTEATTSEAILAEVVFVLSHRRHYNTPRDNVVAGLKTLLDHQGFRMPSKDLCLYALDLWARSPKLSFPDALGAAYSELRGHELATFDAELARTPGVVPYAFGRPT
jgi:predicted nucleic acid-binding protein